MTYRLWRNKYQEGFCVIKSPKLERPWELSVGTSRAEDFPDDVECAMDDRFPKDLDLSDNLHGANVPVVSQQVKEIVQREAVDDLVEFLPVRIRNHKGRLEAETYFLLHPLKLVDCIDQGASGVKWNPLKEGLISRMKGMVLREENIPLDAKIFRIQYMGSNILVRDDLIQALEQANLRGLRFRSTDGFTGMG